MPEKFPFMLGALSVIPGAKVNFARLLEAIIIAAISGSISLYGVTKVLETKLDGLTARLDTVETHEKESRDATRADIREVRVFIQQHIIDTERGHR